MSEEEDPEADALEGAPHPRHAPRLVGQGGAEAAFLAALAGGRLHHGWMLTGPRGVGKATLAWRIARHLLATPPEPAGGGLFGAPEPPTSLDIDNEHPVARRVARLSEGRLLLLRRPWDGEKRRFKTGITVDETRKLREFFGLSAPDGGRRVVIVDSADEMTTQAANGILKFLEEPPENAVLLLIAHQPARLLPTIRSRCRVLPLRPLGPDEIAEVLHASGIAENEAEAAALGVLAQGSAGAAVQLATAGGLALYRDLVALLAGAPGLDRPALIALAESVAGAANAQRLDMMLALTGLLLARIARSASGHPPAAEAVPGEAALLARLGPGPGAGRAWADLAQSLGARAAAGRAVNLDPAALLLDMGVKIDALAARVAAPKART